MFSEPDRALVLAAVADARVLRHRPDQDRAVAAGRPAESGARPRARTPRSRSGEALTRRPHATSSACCSPHATRTASRCPTTSCATSSSRCMIAGHETTATTLAWAFERILVHPEVSRRSARSWRTITKRRRARPRCARPARVSRRGRSARRCACADPRVPRAPHDRRVRDRRVTACRPARFCVPAIHLAHRRAGAYPEPERSCPSASSARSPIRTLAAVRRRRATLPRHGVRAVRDQADPRAVLRRASSASTRIGPLARTCAASPSRLRAVRAWSDCRGHLSRRLGRLVLAPLDAYPHAATAARRRKHPQKMTWTR